MRLSDNPDYKMAVIHLPKAEVGDPEDPTTWEWAELPWDYGRFGAPMLNSVVEDDE